MHRAPGAHAERVEQYRRGELVFDVIDEGPADAPVVVLLHGFPQFNTSWNTVIARLTARGYRCLAPNQRGYSRGARPTRRRDYRLPELVGDVRALIDAGATLPGQGRERLPNVEPGVLTAALNWYRAIPLSKPPSIGEKITVPTMFVWSDGDTGLLEKGARDAERYVSGEYRFVVLHGSHRMLDEQPDTVADLLLEWSGAHPI